MAVVDDITGSRVIPEIDMAAAQTGSNTILLPMLTYSDRLRRLHLPILESRRLLTDIRRSVAAYSRQTFPVDDLSVCRSVRTLVRSYVRTYVPASVCPVHCGKNGGSDADAVWHHRSDKSRDEARSGV